MFSGARTCSPQFSVPCGLAGLTVLVLAFLKVSGLQYTDVSGKIAVVLWLALFTALAVFLLALSGCSWQLCAVCLLPVAGAMFLRVLLLDYCTYDYYDFLGHWAAYFREHGGWAALKDPVGNYNAPYLYFLAAISYFKLSDFYAIKLFSVFFDVLLAWGGLRLCRVFAGDRSRKPVACFCLLLLLPTVVLNGSCWSQCDSIYGAFCLHALASGLDGRPKSSVALLALAFSFKLQTVFLLPLWAALWMSKRVKFSHLWLFPLTYFATCVPALLLGKPLGDILGVYFGQAGEYADYLTLNAPSLYALIPYGMEVNKPLLFRVGLIAGFALVLALLAVLFYFRKKLTNGILLTAAVLFTVGVPLLLPSMHDRYFFLADILTLTWACVSLRRVPQAALVQAASVSVYHTYLKLTYTLPVTLGPFTIVMFFEPLLLLAALVSSAVVFVHQLTRQKGRALSG